MDKSNGYERIASDFLKGRGIAFNGIGKASVSKWAKSLQSGSVILDLGCGTGIPVTMVLVDEGMNVYGVVASPTLAKTFHENFPQLPFACEAVEDSTFFDRQFDGVISIGLIFLLREEAQIKLIQKTASALKNGGKFIFTATHHANTWKDAMTDELSLSLGADRYKSLITGSGLIVVEEWADEGENWYFSCVKI